MSATFTMPPAKRALHKILLSTAQLGSEDMAELRIGVDKILCRHCCQRQPTKTPAIWVFACFMRLSNRKNSELLTRHSVRAALVVAFMILAAPARADLVFFESGRALSVKSYVVEGDSLVLTLRTGGQIVCERAVITRIEPDEVPYPEPEPEPDPTPPAAPVVSVSPAIITPYGEPSPLLL